MQTTCTCIYTSQFLQEFWSSLLHSSWCLIHYHRVDGCWSDGGPVWGEDGNTWAEEATEDSGSWRDFVGMSLFDFIISYSVSLSSSPFILSPSTSHFPFPSPLSILPHSPPPPPPFPSSWYTLYVCVYVFVGYTLHRWYSLNVCSCPWASQNDSDDSFNLQHCSCTNCTVQTVSPLALLLTIQCRDKCLLYLFRHYKCLIVTHAHHNKPISRTGICCAVHNIILWH